jgi:hypothetical protein
MKATSMRISILMRMIFAGVIVLSSAMVSMAQGGMGGVSGIVQDTSNAIVSDATVVLESPSTGVKRTTVSTGGGLYSFVSVPPGKYTLTVSHAGFEKSVQKNITVTVDQTDKVNVSLRVGQVNEVVTVDASSSLLDTSNSTVGQLISAEAIDRVPLLTRDVYQLVQLSAGVLPTNGTANASDTPGIFNARSLIDVSAYTVNGSLQGSVYYMLDGSPIGIAENNAAAILPAFQVPEDGVEEFRVETQNTPATYASGGGGVISLVSKSGTNKFHGDAFGYFRPNALAANDYFYKQNNPGAGTPDFHRYQEGGSIGGPILHDKLFFFGDYEATQQQTLEVGSATVPTDAEKMGDFSADVFTVYNPFAPDVAAADGSRVRQPFAGNMIPSQYWDPVAQNVLKMFPEPNHAGEGDFHTNNFTSSGLDPQNAQKFDARVDYQMNEKSKLFGRFSYGRLDFGNADLYGNEYDPFYYVNITNTRNALIGWDYTLNPKTILQLRYSFTRHFENQTGDPRQAGFEITSLGFPQALADEVLYKQIPTFYLSTTASVGGTGNYDTFIFASENSDASATLTKVVGKHELSAGFEYQKKFMNIGQPPAPAGAYNFDNTPTSSTTFANDSSDFAALLIGMGSCPGCEGGNFTKDIFAAESNPYYAAFIQDTYHVTPKLTFNLGLRWDIFGSRDERHNRQEYFDPTLAYTVGGVSLTGGEIFATNNNRTPFHTNLKDFGPRAAFTWQPQPHFVLRGGAGIYYGPSAEMVANPALNGDGFGSSTNWNATSYATDGSGLSVMLNPLSNPFPNGVVEPLGSSLGPATNIGAGLSTVLHNNRTTTTYNFNLGFEVELPANTVFSLAYVGSRGLFLPLGAVDLNTLSLGEIAQYNGALCVTGGEANCVNVPNTLASIWPTTNPWYGAATVPQWLALEPYPQFNAGGFGSGVTVNGYPGADSEYSSLQAKVEKHMSHHVSTLASFTWGKLLTDDSQPPLGFVGYHSGAPQDWRNLELEHSVSAQDVKLQFNWQTSYDLPIGKGRALNLNGRANTLLGGWTVNTIVYLSDGVPIASPTGTGSPYFNQRVNLNCDPGANPSHTALQWFNYTCFSQPNSPFLPGSAPAFLSSVRTDGAHDLDVSVYKNFAMGRAGNVRIEVSSYNVTNSVQYGYPSVFWNQGAAEDPGLMAGFGQIFNAANQPRQFQFGAKYTF